ncbi:uncharacterized protein LOC118224609 [Anguilla anguilla]|uniref:uncharacterized protein LOC118224609 n=1 Tax=Anguilla anguilla TaxID=7936 RepID=UPI0015B0548B|nr:uncharacterized protein LOC118224609 [Anguilla anguilla]
MVNRNMLVWGFLLVIHFLCIGAEAVYCIKELPCNVTECFKMRKSENAVCSSIQKTEHCSISGTRIKLECEAQLTCFCNEEGPFELGEFPEIPVKDQSSMSMENEVHPEETKRYEGDLSTPEVPERNNTNRTESSGSCMTPLQIAAAVVVPAVVGGAGAIAYCVWKACRKQGQAIPFLQAQGATAGMDRPTETAPGTGPKHNGAGRHEWRWGEGSGVG